MYGLENKTEEWPTLNSHLSTNKFLVDKLIRHITYATPPRADELMINDNVMLN